MTSPQATAHFSLHPMLPSHAGRPRSGITSTAVYANPALARQMIDQLQARARPGTMVLPLILEAVPARGPSATMSGLAGYRIVSRGARTTSNVTTQVNELNAVADQLGQTGQLVRDRQRELMSA